MEREKPPRNDPKAGTGLLEPEIDSAGLSGLMAEGGEAEQSESSKTAAGAEQLAALALSIPDRRSGRVKALRAKIDAGTYQVPGEQVAAALLEYLRVSWKAGGHRQSFGA